MKLIFTKVRLINVFFLSLVLLFASCNYIGSDAIDKRIDELKEKYPVPELSKVQMYADFDTLVSIMERCNPQYLIRKRATGYDMIAEIKAQRRQIENCNNTMDFIKLLKNLLCLTLDEHCVIGNSVWYFRNSTYKQDIKINKIKNRDLGINFHYIHDVFYKYPPQLNLIYTEGKYFLKNKTTFYNDVDSIVMPIGTELSTFNNQQLLVYLDSVKTHGSCWDFNKKIYYSTVLFVDKPQNSIGFKINGTIKEYLFTKFSAIEDDVMKRFHEEKYQAKWFEKDSVIYITIPSMSYAKKWLEQLKSELLLYKEKSVKSVIIDIRGNYGGNNFTWMEVLDMVRITPIMLPSYYLTTMDNDVIKRIKPKLSKEERHLNKRVIEFINPNYQFLTIEGGGITTKNPDSLNAPNLGYEGIIYLLVDADIYSSSGAFASLCEKSDRIKTIGMPTGKLLGCGYDPSVFILPNSRLFFTMTLVLDAYGASKAEDFYHDKITYPVTPSIDYYKYWYDPARPYTIDEKAMYEQDEVFLKALEIIKTENKR